MQTECLMIAVPSNHAFASREAIALRELIEKNRIECDLCMIVRRGNESPLLASFLEVTREFCRTL